MNGDISFESKDLIRSAVFSCGYGESLIQFALSTNLIRRRQSEIGFCGKGASWVVEEPPRAIRIGVVTIAESKASFC